MACEFVTQHGMAGRPFFLYLPLTQLHYPTLPHRDLAGRTGAGDFADSMVEMDHRVGQVIDTVAKTGLAEDTLFIFASDNGPEFRRPGVAPPVRGAARYLKDQLRAIKWRNWKLHVLWEPEPNTGVTHLEVPYLFNVVQDPKEETDVNSTQGWVRGPMRRMQMAFQQSLEKFPRVPPGAPDDWAPGR